MSTVELQTPPGSVLGGGKIHHYHLDRQALVYVRQSTMQQVERHRESIRLQYALAERAVQLGWLRQQVVVIDDDLGLSASSAEGRPGFQRLVSAVGLDQVGIVLGIEMSRLARSSRDWYQLLEVCAIFSTLIGDADGVYDPSQYNDRLLLGLKGTMSEAELHILKQRMLEGKRAKARRGELGMRVPMGYVRQANGEVSKDPDEHAQGVVELLFGTFERLGTVNGLLRYMVENQIRMPVRLSSGLRKGELDWRRPNRVTLSNVLHHPMYAGAYVYGRHPTDPRRKKPARASSGRVVAAMKDWQVLIKDHYPAYISWTQYERNIEQLKRNHAAALGVVRQGPSLLSGLLICGRCGLRMATQYKDSGQDLRYLCSRMATDYGEAVCQTLSGKPLDAMVSRLVLQALEPAALELSLKVAEDLEGERARHHAHWKKRLEQARYETTRAQRQYDAVEPENRLVARTLEKRWEEAIATQHKLEEEYAHLQANEPATLSNSEHEAIRALAGDIPALWHATTTTAADRQAIVRQLIERVLVTVLGDSEKVQVEVHWFGGHHNQQLLIRPVAKLEQLSYYDELLSRVGAMHAQGKHAGAIAQALNDEGWRPAKRRATFNAPMVLTLLRRQGITSRASGKLPSEKLKRRNHEWTLSELAQALEMPEVTLYTWLRRGELEARRVGVGRQRLWLIRADAAMLKQLRQRRAQSKRRRGGTSYTH